MTRESVDQKARRYLAEGRLQVLEVAPGLIRATCRGDGTVYRLGWWRGRWGCTCPAGGTYRASCAHVVALRLVTVEPGRLTAGQLRQAQQEATATRARADRSSAAAGRTA